MAREANGRTYALGHTEAMVIAIALFEHAQKEDTPFSDTARELMGIFSAPGEFSITATGVFI